MCQTVLHRTNNTLSIVIFYNSHEFFSLNGNNDVLANMSLYDNDTSGPPDLSFVSEAPTELDYPTTNSTMPSLSNITSELMEEEEEEEEEEPPDYFDGCEDDDIAQKIPKCRLHEYHELKHQIRLGGEIILVLWSIYYLAVCVQEFRYLGKASYITHLLGRGSTKR